MKRCPFCAEEIQDEAIKCRHCGEILAARPIASQVPVIQRNRSAPCSDALEGDGIIDRSEPPARKRRRLVIYALTIVVLLGTTAAILTHTHSQSSRPVRSFLDAAMANKADQARALCGGKHCWILDYDVRGYTVKNQAKDIVSVEVLFRGWEEKGQIVNKGEIIVSGPKNGSTLDQHVVSNGTVRRMVRFQVQDGAIVGVQ